MSNNYPTNNRNEEPSRIPANEENERKEPNDIRENPIEEPKPDRPV